MAGELVEAKSGSKKHTVAFSREAFTLDAVKKAAYACADGLVVDIATNNDEIVCAVEFLNAATPTEAERLIQNFKIEVLDYQLREEIAERTAPVRNAILAYAFSRTSVQDGE